MNSFDPNDLQNKLLQKRIIDSNGCWIWTGATNGQGYGRLMIRGKYYAIHRLAAYAFKEIPLDTIVIMHSCDVSLCFNPEHLQGGTQQQNLRDMWNKGRWSRKSSLRKYCMRGHKLTPENRTSTGNGNTTCRECALARRRRRRAQNG